MVQLAHNTVLLISLGFLVFTGANAGLIQCPGKIANCGSAQFFQGKGASTGSQNIVSTSPSSTSNFGGRLEVTVFNQQPTVQNVMHVLCPSVEATVQAAVLKYQQLASSTISNHSQQALGSTEPTLVTTKIMDRLPLSFTTSVRKTLAARIHTVKANKQSFFESASHHSSNQQFSGNQKASFGANQQAFGANQQISFSANQQFASQASSSSAKSSSFSSGGASYGAFSSSIH